MFGMFRCSKHMHSTDPNCYGFYVSTIFFARLLMLIYLVCCSTFPFYHMTIISSYKTFFRLQSEISLILYRSVLRQFKISRVPSRLKNFFCHYASIMKLQICRPQMVHTVQTSHSDHANIHSAALVIRMNIYHVCQMIEQNIFREMTLHRKNAIAETILLTLNAAGVCKIPDLWFSACDLLSLP